MQQDALNDNSFNLRLIYDDYFLLLKERDKVNQEFNALGSIVLTANMNIGVLMQNTLEKKKRALARIDASQVGQLHLTSILEEAPIEDIGNIIHRITLGAKVSTLRQEINNELVAYSGNIANITLPHNARRMLYWKIVETLKEKLKSKTMLLAEVKGHEEIDMFICEVVLEELIWLQTQIKKS